MPFHREKKEGGKKTEGKSLRHDRKGEKKTRPASFMRGSCLQKTKGGEKGGGDLKLFSVNESL